MSGTCQDVWGPQGVNLFGRKLETSSILNKRWCSKELTLITVLISVFKFCTQHTGQV